MSAEKDISVYLNHTPVSDPGPHAALLDQIEPDIRALPAQVSALMIHPAIAAMRNLPLTPEQNRDRQRRTVASLLERLKIRDGRPLAEPRALPDKLGGICRDHAMLGVAALRHHGLPARMRGGFSCYFEPGFWDDHWVVEVWHEGAWTLVDTQLGPETAAWAHIGFDAWDVPRHAFVTSPEAWLAVRRNEVNVERLGLGTSGSQAHGSPAPALCATRPRSQALSCCRGMPGQASTIWSTTMTASMSTPAISTPSPSDWRAMAQPSRTHGPCSPTMDGLAFRRR